MVLYSTHGSIITVVFELGGQQKRPAGEQSPLNDGILPLLSLMLSAQRSFIIVREPEIVAQATFLGFLILSQEPPASSTAHPW